MANGIKETLDSLSAIQERTPLGFRNGADMGPGTRDLGVPLPVVKATARPHARNRFSKRLIVPQVQLLIHDRAPEALHTHVVAHSSSTALC